MRKLTDSLGFILSTALAAAILLTTTEGRGQTSTQINLQTQVKGVLPAANGGTGITSLTSGHTYVGDGTNKPQDRAISGDVTLSNTGVVSVVKVNGVAFGASPSTNTVPVVTGLNAITYQAVPNAALANSTITVAGHAVSLGGSTTLQASDLTNGVTGSGSVVLSTSPTLVTPVLGVATATTINRVTITQPATGSTLTIPDGTTATLQGTDTYVGRATTDTLTNKTLTNPANTSQALTDAAPTTWDTSLGAFATWTMGASRTISAPTGLKAGGRYVLLITQDGTGGRTVTWNPVFKGQYGATMAQPNNQASKPTIFTFESDGTNLYLTNVTLQPTVTTFLSGSGTYTTPAGAIRLWARLVGGGGGGGGSGTSGGSGTGGGNTTLGSFTANGGSGGASTGGGSYSGTGGTASGCDLNVSGQDGSGVAGNTGVSGGPGGASILGGAGLNQVFSVIGGHPSKTNSGSGGSGASVSGTAPAGDGGGGGAYCEKLITFPSATYSYAVGGAGGAGGAGTSGAAGGAGAAGQIIIQEFYNLHRARDFQWADNIGMESANDDRWQMQANGRAKW